MKPMQNHADLVFLLVDQLEFFLESHLLGIGFEVVAC
jgi:hypothetical protein